MTKFVFCCFVKDETGEVVEFGDSEKDPADEFVVRLVTHVGYLRLDSLQFVHVCRINRIEVQDPHFSASQKNMSGPTTRTAHANQSRFSVAKHLA